MVSGKGRSERKKDNATECGRGRFLEKDAAPLGKVIVQGVPALGSRTLTKKDSRSFHPGNGCDDSVNRMYVTKTGVLRWMDRQMKRAFGCQTGRGKGWEYYPSNENKIKKGKTVPLGLSGVLENLRIISLGRGLAKKS